MIRISKLQALFGTALATAGMIGWAAPAYGQATRTWVSGVGDDANPCSRTAPCKTFAGAISKTATGGEINCLDPGGFGGLTIVKSISIVCDYTEGGVLSAGAGVNGFVINLPSANDTVFLSGIDFNGAGNAQNGVRIVSGGIVHVRNSIVRNYRAANGFGFSVQPSGLLQLSITNTTIDDNGVAGSPGTGGGILIQPTGAGGSARVTIRDSVIQNNGNNQIRIDSTGNTGAGISLIVDNSQVIGGANGFSVNQAPASTSITTVVQDSFVAFGSGIGFSLAGTSTNRARIGNTTITGWLDRGLNQGGTTVINTYGTNRFDGNVNPSTFTTPAINQQ